MKEEDKADSREEKGKKKRRGRRAFLEDFEKQKDGTYRYKGIVWKTELGREELDKRMKQLLILSILCVILPLAGGFVPAEGLLNTFYVILPYTAVLVAGIAILWGQASWYYHGAQLRDYVYAKTVKALPGRLMIGLIVGAIACLGTTVHIIVQAVIRRPAVTIVWSAVFLILMIGYTAICIYMRKKISEIPYKKA